MYFKLICQVIIVLNGICNIRKIYKQQKNLQIKNE
jgi:hypothetical protein